MFPTIRRLLALVCLFLALQLATAQSFDVVRRADGGATPAPTSAPPEPKPTKDGDRNDKTATGDGDARSKEAPATVSKRRSTTSDAAMSSTTAPSMTTGHTHPTISPTNGALDNSSFVNVTIPTGHLPLKPKLTPGWGVAGTIMLLSGLVYTLIGIKNRWVHTFFSTAYLSGLGIAVLIIYVMSVPVHDAVQGGYVVAVVVSGCVIGAASMFFKELTEGLGCALGGFCLSMWLLCLVPGGLLHPTVSKAVFIACFTLVGFAFYFSRFTRDWALIILISFGGATVAVLGIDCFSRAGLKEFWVYIWDLNDDLFPLGATTYPVTKGIRVETAAIIIICLFGIISQIKLWRIVREKKEKRAAERAEGQRDLEEEEENVGREVERANARERRQWERIYGDGGDGSTTLSRDYDVDDTGSEKKLRDSYLGSSKPRSSTEVIEMADMSEPSQFRCGPERLLATEQDNDGKVTVRVAADDIPGSPFNDQEQMNEKGGNSLADAQTPMSAADLRRTSRGSKRASKATLDSKRGSRTQAVTEAPEVVPLPFTVPNDGDSQSVSQRSSVATFADEVEDPERPASSRTPQPQRHSLVQRLSQNSATLLRSLSQKSARSSVPNVDRRGGESSDELVPASHRRDVDNGSLAATIDDESVSGDGRVTAMSTYSRNNIEITPKLAENSDENPIVESTQLKVKKQRQHGATDLTETETQSPQVGMNDSPAVSSSELSDKAESKHPAQPKSVVSVASTSASLTRERLPQSLSRVAMSYRTNEWAKHLSHAEAPEPDDLNIINVPQPVKKTKEKIAPVNVDDLQRTAEEGVPATAPTKRSVSQASQISDGRSIPRSASRQSVPERLSIPTYSPTEQDGQGRSPTSPGMNHGPSRTTSGLRWTSSGFAPIAEEHDGTTSGTTTIPEDVAQPRSRPASRSPSLSQAEGFQRPPVPGIISYDSPQTLLGQREAFLRSKSQGNLVPYTPEPAGSIRGAPSESGSLRNYPMYPASVNADADDIPLNQRKHIMRTGSLMSLVGASSVSLPRAGSGIEASESTTFNSHQPQRVSTLPTPAAREAQLASFRQSVAQELRAGTPMMTPSGRETPFASTNSLLGGRESEVQRNIEMQRNVLLGQKEAEGQRKELQQREREWADKAFEERMRTGELIDAHREVMRKMQRGAKGR